MAVTEVKNIQKSVCNRNQSREDFKSHYICLTKCDHTFNLDEIKFRDTIEYYINMSVDETYE